jgi:putative multicomponent Na+:H+ antiporter subunit B
MNDTYLYVIIALLPLAASMVVSQVNPYNALVIRGILGAVAAMLYAILGAPDVALTEALVGTMLAITLYAIAVRSSLVMRLGLVENEAMEPDDKHHFGQLMDDLRKIFGKRQMRLELVPYPNTQALQRALMDKEVHATCVRREQLTSEDEKQFYHTAIRVKRIYEIMQTELASPATILSYVSTPDSGEEHK